MNIDELQTYCTMRGDRVRLKEVTISMFCAIIQSQKTGTTAHIYYIKYQDHIEINRVRLRRFGQSPGHYTPVNESASYQEALVALTG